MLRNEDISYEPDPTDESPEVLSEPERRREQIIESIDARVNSALGLRSAIEDIEEQGLRGEDADQRLEERARQLLDKNFPNLKELPQQEVAELQEEIKSANLEIEQLYNKLRYLGEKRKAKGLTEKDEEALERLNEDVEKAESSKSRARARLKETEAPTDREFVGNISAVVSALKRKRETVEQYLEQKEEGRADSLLGVIKNCYPDLSTDAILHVEFGAYAADVFVDTDALNEAYRNKHGQVVDNIDGLHLPFSPVNLIAGKRGKTVEDYGWTLTHERTHNYLDAMFMGQDSWAQAGDVETMAGPLRTDLDDIEVAFKVDRSGNVSVEERVELQVDDDGTVSMEGERTFEVRPKPVEVIDALKDEVLAELELLEYRWKCGDDEERVKHDAKSPPERFESLLDIYSTAGTLAKKYRDALRAIARDESRSKAERDAANGVEGAFIRQFLRMDAGLRKGFASADRIGDDAKEAVHAFAAVMEPSQYRHASWYLKQRYPDRT